MTGQQGEAGNEQQTPKPGFLEDNDGNPSSMRLLSFIALFASIGFGVIVITNRGSTMNGDGLIIFFAFLVAAFAPKALQKLAESKFPPK